MKKINDICDVVSNIIVWLIGVALVYGSLVFIYKIKRDYDINVLKEAIREERKENHE